MCGPYAHYLIERMETILMFPPGSKIRIGAELREVTSTSEIPVMERVFVRAGIDIATGEPCTNDGTELTDEEKDTLRFHFVSEYPTWRELWKKHIQPHYAARGDQDEWDATLRRLLRGKVELLSVYCVKLDNGAIAVFRPDREKNLAALFAAWSHPENRVGYWANPQEPVRKPAKPVAFKWRADANSHAELLLEAAK